MEPERGISARRRLEDTLLPACDVLWLASNGVHTLQCLLLLRLDQIERFKGYKECLLVPICLLALVEGESIGGMSVEEMEVLITRIIGRHPDNPKEILQGLAGFQARVLTLYSVEIERSVA